MKAVPQQSIAKSGWLGSLMSRMSHLWHVKMIGTIGATLGFFKAYFWVLRTPKNPAYVMPLTSVDEWINFAPWAIVIYASLWLYVGLLPAVYTCFRELLIYATGSLSLTGIGLAMFYWLPTVIAIPEDLNRSAYPGFSVLEGIDSPGNAFPSLHVAFAVFTTIGFHNVFKEVKASWVGYLLNFLWCLSICYSTIATRQHVFWDLVAGLTLGTFVGFPTFFAVTLSKRCTSR
jgi:membrane-associated phospholipid phosphatase